VIWHGPLGVCRAEVSQPKREVDVATQHRSRRARAIQKGRIDAAQGLDDLRIADDDLAPVALVVDDEPFVRQFVSTVLRREGWSVLEAADAIAARAVADLGPLDLLVTDYDMPVVTGVALARQLRELDEDLPVLMVSGHPDAARKVRSLRGRTAFAQKPVAVEELVASIGSIVD
jgi:CheY-like chemotaxis protein